MKQSDRNSLKADLLQEPTTYEQHPETSSEKKNITFARHECRRIGVFRIKMKSLGQKL